MFPTRIELRTFSVLGRLDNNYTMETTSCTKYFFLVILINKIWCPIFYVKPIWANSFSVRIWGNSCFRSDHDTTTTLFDSERERHSWKTLALQQWYKTKTKSDILLWVKQLFCSFFFSLLMYLRLYFVVSLVTLLSAILVLSQ